MPKRIWIDETRCSGCKICEQICAKTHYNSQNSSKTALKIHTVFTEEKIWHTHTVCQQCGPDAPCIRSCPTGALYWKTDGKVPHLAIDLNKCEGLFVCVSTCPYNAIYRHPALNNPIFCDLCEGDPQCMRWCPMGAIRLVE